MVDSEFRLVHVSAGAQKVFSNVRPLLGRDFAEVLRIVWPDPFATQAISLFRRTLETGEPYHAPSTVERRNDTAEVESYDWKIERVAMPNATWAVVCHFYDLSERQRYEAELKQSEERFQLAARAASDAVWDWNLAAKTAWWSEGIRSFGHDPESIGPDPERWWLDHLHPADRERVERSIHAVIGGSAPSWREEYRFRRGDGTFAEILDRGFVIREASGAAVRMVGAMQDLTLRRQSERALAQAEEKARRHAEELEVVVAERTARLQETVTELENFSYTVSHDLRAPLRSMSGYAQVLLEEYSADLDDSGRDMLRRIGVAARRMDALTTDLLSYSRVSKALGGMEPVNLDVLVDEVLTTIPTLRSDASLSRPASLGHVIAHPTLMNHVLSNLLENAVKFKKPGSPAHVTIRTEARTLGTVRLWVEDDGIGIEPRHHHRIFQIFERVASELKAPGTGVGLAIVAKSVARMGGECGVESSLGGGSRFWVDLRAATSETEMASDAEPNDSARPSA